MNLKERLILLSYVARGVQAAAPPPPHQRHHFSSPPGGAAPRGGGGAPRGGTTRRRRGGGRREGPRSCGWAYQTNQELQLRPKWRQSKRREKFVNSCAHKKRSGVADDASKKQKDGDGGGAKIVRDLWRLQWKWGRGVDEGDEDGSDGAEPNLSEEVGGEEGADGDEEVVDAKEDGDKGRRGYKPDDGDEKVGLKGLLDFKRTKRAGCGGANGQPRRRRRGPRRSRRRRRRWR